MAYIPGINITASGFVGIDIRVEGFRDIIGRFANTPRGIQHYMYNAYYGRYIYLHQEPMLTRGTYIRTHHLLDGWKKPNSDHGKLFWRISNPTVYAPYVQGDAQTWFHAETGWHVMETVLDEAAEIAKLDAEIQMALNTP